MCLGGVCELTLTCRWPRLIALLVDDSFSFSTCSRYFNHAEISSCTPAVERLPFPHIRAISLLIETYSAATAFSQGGKWQVKIFEASLTHASLPLAKKKWL